MNIGYVLYDMLYLAFYAPSIEYFWHHGLAFLGGITIKEANVGSEIWTFVYPTADIATVILHFSWFARNVMINLQSVFNLYQKKSVQETSKFELRQDILDSSMEKVAKYEKIFLLSFATLFLYIRLYKLTTVAPYWVYNSLAKTNDPKWGIAPKAIGTTWYVLLCKQAFIII